MWNSVRGVAILVLFGSLLIVSGETDSYGHSGGRAPESSARPQAAQAEPAVSLTVHGDPPDPTEVSDELKKIYHHIDANFDTHLERLLKWIRIPSISNTVEGKPAIWESAELIRDIIVEDLGCTAEIYGPGIADWSAPGHPVVYGRCDVGAEKTIIDYGMGDVMPIFRPELWELPPFAGQMKEMPPYKRVLVGRGASNHKGKDMAEINALISIKAVTGTLPVNVVFAIEHDEERMDLGLRKLMFDHPELFKDADAAFVHGNTQAADGRGRIVGQSIGCVVFDLETSGDSGLWLEQQPLWRHLEILDTLFEEDSALMKDIATDIVSPSEEEVAHLRREAQLNARRASNAPMADTVSSALPTFEDLIKVRTGVRVTITGTWAGNTAPGYAGHYRPPSITSKIDIRYPPNVDGEDVINKVRAYLERHGYLDVKLNVVGVVPWAWVNTETEIARAAIRMFKQFGVEYNEFPRGDFMGALAHYYGPNYLFSREPLQIPSVMAGLSLGDRVHTNNEYLVIQGDGKKIYGFTGAMKGFATILYNFAGKN